MVEEEENVWEGEEELKRGRARKLGREDGEGGSEKEVEEKEKRRRRKWRRWSTQSPLPVCAIFKPRLPGSIISSY